MTTTLRRALPVCLPVRPAVLVAAARGAAARADDGTTEVVRAIRDHRDDLADDVVLELLQVIATVPAVYRHQWRAALIELRRPSLSQRARTRAARAERAGR